MATPQLPELPKISGFIEPLARPEIDIAARIREATKVAPPPMPAGLALSVAKSLEARKAPPGVPRMPEIEQILRLPELPGLGGSKATEKAPETTKVETEVGKRAPITGKYSARVL